jgi:hypothetical protein
MMVKQRSRAVFDRINGKDQSLVPDPILIQCHVKWPPKPFQDLGEILWSVSRNPHTSSKSSIKMGVGADIAWQQVLPTRVDDLLILMLFIKVRPYLLDPAILYQQLIIIQDLIFFFPGYQLTIFNDHVVLLI